MTIAVDLGRKATKTNKKTLLVLFASKVILHAFLSSADFFQNQLFQKILSRMPSECQTDWIQIRLDILSGLVWVHSVCKGYQQTTLVGNELIPLRTRKLLDQSCPFSFLLKNISF